MQNINKLNASVCDKLDVIKNELATIDENWREWTFVQFLEMLEKWTINDLFKGSKVQSQRPSQLLSIKETNRQRST